MVILLQMAGFIALVLFIVLMLCLIPTIFYLRRRVDEMANSAKKLEVELEGVANDSRRLVAEVNVLAAKINAQADHAGTIIDTVKSWTALTDRVVTGVGAIVEPPLTGIVRNLGWLKLGVNVFTQVLRARNKSKDDSTKLQEVQNV